MVRGRDKGRRSGEEIERKVELRKEPWSGKGKEGKREQERGEKLLEIDCLPCEQEQKARTVDIILKVGGYCLPPFGHRTAETLCPDVISRYV